MLPENERVVARTFRVEVAVAVVRIGKTVREIELKLSVANITSAVGVLVGAVLVPKKITGNMFHRVQAQPVAFGLLDQPADGSQKITAHVLFERVRVGIQIRLCHVPKTHPHTG